MSPSRFELETLSVLDSRDNRLHHGDTTSCELWFSDPIRGGCLYML